MRKKPESRPALPEMPRVGPPRPKPAVEESRRPPLPKAPKVEKKAPAKVEPAPAGPVAFTMKRRQKLGAEDLRKQLLLAEEVNLDAVPNTTKIRNCPPVSL